MQVLYMNMPELPRTRHIIVGDRHIINTAAPESKIFHRVVRKGNAYNDESRGNQRSGISTLAGQK